jgi:uncharacterized protein YqjF (DUF2071 family)
MTSTFLTAEWGKLIMANYVVAEDLLQPYLPLGTQLDRYDGRCYVSLVGFLFQNTRLRSVPIPFHRTFEEVNLRFYVQHTTSDGKRRRGVVFISEFVPRLALTLVANTLYGENYVTLPTSHYWKEDSENRTVAYRWGRDYENLLAVTTALNPQPIVTGSAEEFFTEHYWGYTKRGNKTSEYEVLHPRWKIYPVFEPLINVDFGHLYGSRFASLSNRTPESILLAEGSEVEVRTGERIAAAS